MHSCLNLLSGSAIAFVVFTAVSAADTNSPQLLSFNVAPQFVDTSSGPTTMSVTIAARDDSSGFGGSVGNGSIAFTHESGTTVFGRQMLPITAGTTTFPVFQFLLTVPQFSPPGIYRISLVLVDNASHIATFSAKDLQTLGFSSAIIVTQSGLGSVGLIPSSANFAPQGGPGSLQVSTSSGGFSWSAVSNASWLTVTSGAFGAGNGTINYFAAANTSTALRTALITVAGQVFTIIEAAASSSLNMTAISLFTYYVGGTAPPPQSLTIYSNGPSVNFTATASSVGNWLLLNQNGGATSTTLSVFVNPFSLAPGTYTGRISVAAVGSIEPQVQTVTLVVSAAPTVTVS